jgi:MAM domain.
LLTAAPQIAAASPGDCTFEVDECGWANSGPRDHVDDIDWDRISGQATRTSTHDHTLGSEKGMKIQYPFVKLSKREI